MASVIASTKRQVVDANNLPGSKSASVTSTSSSTICEYSYEDFVWSYERNEKAISKYIQKPREKNENEPPLTGSFVPDYLRNCKQLGIQPHPDICLNTIKQTMDVPNTASSVVGKGGKKRIATPSDRARTEVSPPIDTLTFHHHRIDMGTLQAIEKTLGGAHKNIVKMVFNDCKLTRREIEVIARICEDFGIQQLSINFNGGHCVDAPVHVTPTQKHTSSSPNLLPSFNVNQELGMYSLGSVACYQSLWISLVNISSLQALSLRGNQLSSKDAATLFQAVASNKHLITLDLSFNRIGDFAMMGCAEALLTNKTLLGLNLGNNYITDTGARVLFSAFVPVEVNGEEAKHLKKNGFPLIAPKTGRTYRDCNSTLRHLSLAVNPMGSSNTWLCALEIIGGTAEQNDIIGLMCSTATNSAICIDHDAQLQRRTEKTLAIADIAVHKKAKHISPIGSTQLTQQKYQTSSSDSLSETVFPLPPQTNAKQLYALAQQAPQPLLLQPQLSSLQLNNTTLPVPTMPMNPNAGSTAMVPEVAVRARAMGRRQSQSGPSVPNPEPLVDMSLVDGAKSQHLVLISNAQKQNEAVPTATMLGMTSVRNKLTLLNLQGNVFPPIFKTHLQNVSALSL